MVAMGESWGVVNGGWGVVKGEWGKPGSEEGLKKWKLLINREAGDLLQGCWQYTAFRLHISLTKTCIEMRESQTEKRFSNHHFWSYFRQHADLCVIRSVQAPSPGYTPGKVDFRDKKLSQNVCIQYLRTISDLSVYHGSIILLFTLSFQISKRHDQTPTFQTITNDSTLWETILPFIPANSILFRFPQQPTTAISIPTHYQPPTTSNTCSFHNLIFSQFGLEIWPTRNLSHKTQFST